MISFFNVLRTMLTVVLSVKKKKRLVRRDNLKEIPRWPQAPQRTANWSI